MNPNIQSQEIETELIAFLQRDIFGADVAVTPELDLVGAGFDSMSLVKLLLFVETKYGKWIPEGEITGESLASIRALSATVAKILNEK